MEELIDTITCGQARQLAAAIPDESVDFIFTDPLYEEMDDYLWLSETAMRVLKPDSACLAWYGIGYLPWVHQAMLAGGLNYRWRLITRMVRNKEFHGRVCVMTQECAWYEKGTSRPRQSIFDFQYSTEKGLYLVDGANWGKAEDSLERYVETFCPPGGIVFDPFCGSGTTAVVAKKMGRRFIAFEQNDRVALAAQERVLYTQPALPLAFEPVAIQENLL